MIMACKICLETEGSLQRVTSGEVRDAYRHLTGIEWDTSGGLPQHMCWECSARLRGAVCLRRKALASLSMLDEILENQPSVTSSHIHNADRTRRSLKSNIRTMHFSPNGYLAGVSIQCDKQTNTIDDDCLQMRKRCEGYAKTYKNRKLVPIESVEHAKKDNGNTARTLKLEYHSEESRSANDASDTGSLEIVAIDAAVVKTEDKEYDSDNSVEKLLVIDDEEPMEDVLSSEYVGKNHGETPKDELIDTYNNDGDGDGRLQELNKHFGGESSIQIDQGWGVGRDAGGRLRPRAVRAAPVPCVAPGPAPCVAPGPAPPSTRVSNEVDTSMRNISKNLYMPRRNVMLNPDMFTFTRVSVQEQIAEVTKRQYSLQFREAAIKCLVCFRCFPSTLTYDAHMQRHDPTRGDFECSICKVRHPCARTLKRHGDVYHAVKIVCNGCDFVTMNRSAAQNHEKFHEGTTYQCMYCPGRFNQQSTYKSHMRRRHLHADACALCGSTFLSARGLSVHRCRMHPDADKVPLQGPHCSPCDLVFATYGAYTRHLSLSSRHGPYFSNEPLLSVVKPRETRE